MLAVGEIWDVVAPETVSGNLKAIEKAVYADLETEYGRLPLDVRARVDAAVVGVKKAMQILKHLSAIEGAEKFAAVVFRLRGLAAMASKPPPRPINALKVVDECPYPYLRIFLSKVRQDALDSLDMQQPR